MKKLKRTVVHVVWDRARKVWCAELGGMVFLLSLTSQRLIDRVAEELNYLWRNWSIPGELIIHNKNGTIGKGSSSRRTYGLDSPRTPG